MDRHHDSSDIGNYAYDETFFRYIEQGAMRSAEVVVPLIVDQLKVNSVLDVGCGAGAWLAEYRRLGLPTYIGVDGEYVNTSTLLIPPSAFVPLDIAKSFDLRQRFDLVQCLEVGEHIQSAASRTLVANLVRHGNVVLFSAAIPGQGGENHINEQPYEFWRALFAEHGYSGYDFLRPLLRRESSVEVWYRHNAILYVANNSRAQLPASVAVTEIAENEPIRDVSSIPYKVRTRILARFSVASLTRFAILKHKWLILVRSVRGLRSRKNHSC